MHNKRHFFQMLLLGMVAASCGSSKMASTGANSLPTWLNDSALVNAHVGLLVVDAESGKTMAAHNEHRYFVPASNTKLWTMYTGLKYLGDSLVAGYLAPGDKGQASFRSNGDPTFLHRDYKHQPLADALKKYSTIHWLNATMRTTEYGNGWSWNDYDATYMAPRSSLPMFGNVVSFSLKDGQVSTEESIRTAFLPTGTDSVPVAGFSVYRKFDDPMFSIGSGNSKNQATTLYLSPDANLKLASAYFKNTWLSQAQTGNQAFQTIYSQPTDSMLRPLMHRSDNFFAEQTLLMVSNQWFGYMNERAVIDSLLKTDLKGLPDKPRWVDGSGLSRYNLFTPADYIWLLQKMRAEFPMTRLQDILPTGNDGTLTNYYTALQGKVFAKTGTLAGVVALSGYLYARSGRLLLFSVLVNNHNGSAPAVRRAVEKYLMSVWEKH